MKSAELELKKLESRIDELIRISGRLGEENRALRASQRTLQMERAGLLEKNDRARNRVEAMIMHLNSMEHST
ncbi:MAG: TIGR02449 family protein [Gammaproteobacteria bacterium]|nr:MAG: TIGR02449 family protein [Gammaproteobacteria bacterium]